VLTTRVCACAVDETTTASMTTAAAWRVNRDIGVEGRIAGWSMCARIHSNGTGDRRARYAESSGKRNSEHAYE
jgi:hypothetical protein